MKKRFLWLIGVALSAAVLTGCAKTATESTQWNAAGDFSVEEPSAAEDAGLVRDELPSAAAPEGESKMVYRARLELETLDYEAAEQAICDLVSACGGYFENRSVLGASSGYRSADFTVRVPQEQYETFCARVGEACQVTYLSSSAENITEAYYDTSARLETARIKLARLQALLAEAESMADIITIEGAISETEYTIESLSGTLRHYDALVDYATVTLSLCEVYRLSGTQSAPLGFFERLGNALQSGARNAGAALEELVIGRAGMWVALVAAAAAAVVIVRILRRRAAAKKGGETPPEP